MNNAYRSAVKPGRFSVSRLPLVAVGLAVGVSCHASFQSVERFTPDISLEPQRPKVACGEKPADLQAMFEAMMTGPDRARACVALLEETTPGWQGMEGTQGLIGPFISYMLGDDTQRGLQRHAIIIDLLGHLEEIEPGWRYHPAARARMREIIHATVVEDPFVAHFWTTTLQEMDPEWRQSETAGEMAPAIYERALDEATKTTGPPNARPAELLRELSWPRYAWLKIYTTAFDSWPKRIGSGVLLLLMVLAIIRLFRRKKSA